MSRASLELIFVENKCFKKTSWSPAFSPAEVLIKVMLFDTRQLWTMQKSIHPYSSSWLTTEWLELRYKEGIGVLHLLYSYINGSRNPRLMSGLTEVRWVQLFHRFTIHERNSGHERHRCRGDVLTKSYRKRPHTDTGEDRRAATNHTTAETHSANGDSVTLLSIALH